jgi:hypothetical protein
MRVPALRLLVVWLLLMSSTALAAPILVNEYNAVSAANFLSGTAAGTNLSRVQGNGADWIERVVIQDNLDLRSGTIITVAEDIENDPTSDPLGGDWWINVQAILDGPTQFITASDFSTSNDNTQITVLDALGQIWFGPAGEGVMPASGVGGNEVWKLEADPSASITPLSNFTDGSSSTFGAPNQWSG